MLDVHSPIHLSQLSDVRVYPDTTDSSTFYALPVRPAVEDLELTLTGRKVRGRFEAERGVVSLTTVLTLAESDRQRVERLLTQRAEGMPVRLAPVTWAGGRVVVTLLPGLTLEGSPSLYGDNRCSLQRKLDEPSARELEKAWGRGLPDAQAEYLLQLGGTPSSARRSFRLESSTRVVDGVEEHAAAARGRTERRAGGSAQELRFAGSLDGEAGAVRRIGM
ncbi:MAG: hypothetical protein AAF481_12400 [Acidobacteriota bacterium]